MQAFHARILCACIGFSRVELAQDVPYTITHSLHVEDSAVVLHMHTLDDGEELLVCSADAVLRCRYSMQHPLRMQYVHQVLMFAGCICDAPSPIKERYVPALQGSLCFSLTCCQRNIEKASEHNNKIKNAKQKEKLCKDWNR